MAGPGRPVTADCRLPTADCRLPTADCRLPTADCRLPTVDRGPWTDGTGAWRPQPGTVAGLRAGDVGPRTKAVSVRIRSDVRAQDARTAPGDTAGRSHSDRAR